MYDFEKSLYYRVSIFFGSFYALICIFVWKFLPFLLDLDPQIQQNYHTFVNVMIIIVGICFFVFPLLSIILLLIEKFKKNKIQFNINKNNFILRIIYLDLFIISQIFFLFQLILFITLIIFILIYAPGILMLLLIFLIIAFLHLIPLLLIIFFLVILMTRNQPINVHKQDYVQYDSSSMPFIERKESKIMIIIPSVIIIFMLFHFMCIQFVDFLEKYKVIEKSQSPNSKGYFEPEYRIINDLCYQYIIKKYKQ